MKTGTTRQLVLAILQKPLPVRLGARALANHTGAALQALFEACNTLASDMPPFASIFRAVRQ